MDVVIKMRVKQGDKHVSKALIKMYDEDGVQLDGQLLLEGETAETGLTIPEGGYCAISEVRRPIIFDREQKAAMEVDFTPGDPLTQPPHADNTLPGQVQVHEDDIKKQREREQAAVKEAKEAEDKRKKDAGASGKMGAPPSHEKSDDKHLQAPPLKK